MKTVGHWNMSATDSDVVSIDFAEDLLGAAISGTPTVAGENCTATYRSHETTGLVTATVTNGDYSGACQITIATTDGRTVGKQVTVSFY